MTPAPTPGGAGNSYQAQFNQAYCTSKNPALWPFYAGRPDTSGNARWSNLTPLTPQETWALFARLLALGYVLDEEIEGEGLDPYTAMWMRSLVYGQTWEPAGTGDVQVTSVGQSGAVVTPGEFIGPVPPGQIKVSIMISDYPAYVAPPSTEPTPAPMQPLANPVGPLKIPSGINALTQVGGLFATLVNSQGLDGYVMSSLWPATGTAEAQGLIGQWQKVPGMMGMGAYWEKIS